MMSVTKAAMWRTLEPSNCSTAFLKLLALVSAAFADGWSAATLWIASAEGDCGSGKMVVTVLPRFCLDGGCRKK